MHLLLQDWTIAILQYHIFQTRAFHSRKADLLVVSRVSKSRAFSYQAPLFWNQLPVYAWEADTLSTFKIRLLWCLLSPLSCPLKPQLVKAEMICKAQSGSDLTLRRPLNQALYTEI